MPKFTQGNWEEEGDIVIAVSPDSDEATKIADVYGDSEEEYCANARLIAAAPEMYKMFKEELIPTSNYGGILSFERERRVRELLARIEGGGRQWQIVGKPMATAPSAGGRAIADMSVLRTKAPQKAWPIHGLIYWDTQKEFGRLCMDNDCF